MNKRRIAGATLLLAVFVLLGGCQQSLFNNSDSYTRSRIDRYYGGDSAIETRATRSHANEMGFGFPTGMANQ